jgi:DNA-binding MarR family transcriptional regulator
MAGDACPYVIGDDGLGRWSPVHADAWIGLLDAHKRLTRALEGELEARHGLTLSSLELLGRLAAAPHRERRISDLAAGTGLSLSRVSRVAATLEGRGLLVRRSVAEDSRGVRACLTDAGLQLTRAAQATHAAGVQRLFFDRLTPTQLATLAEVFGTERARR